MNEIKKQITESLVDASTSFYEQALSIYLTHKDKASFDYPQVAIGNFCVAIELTAKSLIALKCFPLIFPKEKSIKIFQALHYPETISKEEIKSLIDDIQYSRLDTLNYQETMSLLKKIYPNEVKDIYSYFKITRDIRNSSLHSFIFKTSERALFTVAFISINLMKILDSAIERKGLAEFDINEIISNFESVEVKTAQSAIEEAQNRLRDIKVEKIELNGKEFETFYEFNVKCPVCEGLAHLEGRVYEDWADNHHERPSLDYIQFIPESFNCTQCKLKLKGHQQLNEISMTEYIDLSDKLEDYLEHLAQCHEEQYDYRDDEFI